MDAYKKVYLAMCLLVIAIVLVACGTKSDEGNFENHSANGPTETLNYPEEVNDNPIITITMEDNGQIVIELEPKVAPNTVANFVSLVEQGFYDGLIFHRVIPGFMIQGGDPLGNGTGGPDYSIEGEFTTNGFENNMKHERGVISMARTNDPNSAGSQFFIMVEESPSLDGEYAAFGKVVKGMEIVDAIVSVERDQGNKPLKDQVMKKVEVDTRGSDYPEPKKVE